MATELDQASVGILRGRLAEIGSPLVPHRVVRLYVSSTGPDSQTERNAFVDRVYPSLRQHCRNKYGVEFQIVDLDWGLSPDQSHVTPISAEFRQGEITRCETLSEGPTFLAFVGQRYGDCPLRATIFATEFETIRLALHQMRGRETRSAPLLDDWYVKDENYVPPVYVLRPAEEMLEGLKSEDEKERQTAEAQKDAITAKLRRLLQRGADYCYNNGTLDSETRCKYFMSEQDMEMTMGIGESGSPKNQCLLVLRNIVDLKNYIDDEKTQSFTEIIYNDKIDKLEFNLDAESRLSQTKARAKYLVSPINTLSYDVLWRYDDVINSKLHKEYLDKLCNQLQERLIQAVDMSLGGKRFDFPTECEEPLLHLHRCQQIGAEFYGANDNLATVREYLQQVYPAPLVVHGPQGCGKTKLLSRVAHEVPYLLGEASDVIVRYIGYTPMSSDVRQLLRSMCSQICSLFDINQEEIPTELKDITKYFHDLLLSVPSSRTLIIILDGLDQIHPDHNDNTLTWLPSELPEHVKMIVSCQSDHPILQTLRTSVIVDDSFYLQLDSLSGEECDLFMREALGVSGKQLTQEQYEVYQKCFTKCSLPMFVHLVSEEAKTLHSFCDVEHISRPTGLVDAIHKFFDKLEHQHGTVFVLRCMSFLAASESGLSDCEMEDLLSLDEYVLNDEYTTYHPAIRRIPPMKWLKLKRSIEPFISSRNTDGATIYMWSHSLFLQVSKERYLGNEDIKQTIHSILADYYLGTWANNPKPVTPKRRQGEIVTLPCGGKADRKVPDQPLTFQRNGLGVRFNKRKYDKVPRHLDLSGRTDELNKLVLFNYEWLYNKIKALSLQHIMTDFELSPGAEASLVEGALRVAEPTISKDINNLSSEISGHLLPYYSTHPHIRELINQCDTIGLKHCALVPKFPYHTVPGTSLQFTMECPVSSEYFGFLNDDRYLLTKERNSSNIYVFDLLTGVLKNIIFASNGDFLVTPNGKHLVIVDYETEKAIKFHEAETGSFLGQIIILNHIQMKPSETYKKGPMCVTDDRLCAIVTTEMSYLCIAEVPTCKLLQIVALDGRSSVCEISPDGQYVFCSSNEYLLTYDLESLDLVCSISVGYKPKTLAFTQDGCRAFISNNFENKVYILHLNCGIVDMTYKSVFDEELKGDSIVDLKVSPNDDYILIRGKNTILVHDRATERICAKLNRPLEVPQEFRLPKSHYVELNFTQAQFSRDGVYVIGAIFRNVYIWAISTQRVVTMLQAPIGMISSMLVSRGRSQVITQLENNKGIQVWNVEDAVNDIDVLDRVVGPIQQMIVSESSSIAFVQCYDSDAIGVVDLRSGTMLDLLTHDCNVKDMAVTPDGANLMLSVAPKMSNTAIRIWDMTERKVIKEFGNVPGYCVSLNEKNRLFVVGQKDRSFCSPFYVRSMEFTVGSVSEEEYPEPLDFLLKKPFVTRNDGYLVALSAKDYVKWSGKYVSPTICTFDLKKGMLKTCYTAQELIGVEVDSIVDMRPHPVLDNRIGVIYTLDTAADYNHNDIPNGYPKNPLVYGFMMVEIGSGWVDRVVQPFLDPSINIPRDVIYSSDFTFCMNKDSQMISLINGEEIGKIATPSSSPKILALEGTVVIYYSGSIVDVIRIADNVPIAQCDVHGTITYIKLCKDDRTLIIGCSDGTIVSYVLIDPKYDNPKPILDRISSRHCTAPAESTVQNGEQTDGQEPTIPRPPMPSRSSKTSRSWDKIDQVSSKSYSRPPSVQSAGPRDKDLLRRIPHVPRPKSDTQLYSKSAVCSVM